MQFQTARLKCVSAGASTSCRARKLEGSQLLPLASCHQTSLGCMDGHSSFSTLTDAEITGLWAAPRTVTEVGFLNHLRCSVS